MTEHFADRLATAIFSRGSCVCVGLDPRLERLPDEIVRPAFARQANPAEAAAQALLDFGRGVVDAVCETVPVVKIQIAFYEMLGWQGIRAYQQTVTHARDRGLLVIGDAKRGDIGSTSEAYARGHLGRVTLVDSKVDIWHEDALTVNPFLGTDAVQPFVVEANANGKGVFVLVKTSNPSSIDLQDLVCEDLPIYAHVGRLVNRWGRDFLGECGYSCVGAVVGATFPGSIQELREVMPHAWFLLPGFGAQGAGAQDVAAAFDRRGLGGIVNSSRGIIFAYEKGAAARWTDAVAEAARRMTDELRPLCSGDGA